MSNRPTVLFVCLCVFFYGREKTDREFVCEQGNLPVAVDVLTAVGCSASEPLGASALFH